MKRVFVSLMAVLAFFAADAGTYKAFEGKYTMTETGIVGLYEAEGKVYMEIPFDLMGKGCSWEQWWKRAAILSNQM
jgi:hypothetical protein